LFSVAGGFIIENESLRDIFFFVEVEADDNFRLELPPLLLLALELAGFDEVVVATVATIEIGNSVLKICPVNTFSRPILPVFFSYMIKIDNL
jgi:hypothetical protein